MVHVRFTKWDGSLHWHFDVFRLGEDAHGVWLGGPDDTPVRRGEETAILSPAFALLIPSNGWWTATFNSGGEGSPFGYIAYVDICTPPVWDAATVTAVDLDLDVAMSPDRVVTVLDEDEFAEHRLAMDYPPHVVDHARAAAASVFQVMAAGGEPFAAAGPRWLERAMTLPG